MNEKVLRITEFHKITERLAGLAGSEPGKRLCRELTPMGSLYDIEQAQAETASAVTYVLRKGSMSFGAVRDFTDTFRALAVEASLSAPQLLQLASFLENVAKAKSYGVFEKDPPEDDRLRDIFDCLYPVKGLSNEIRRCVLSEDDIADDASPELRRIRRSILQTGERVHTQLTKMVNSTYASYLQESLITIRNGRYCLPVRAEYKGSVPGMVHDQSSSGSTLFIEPAAVVELNNQLRVLSIEEQKEIERILAVLSAACGEHLAELRADAENMSQLDLIFAKARLALDMEASRPVFNDRHYIRINRGRHPLIDPQKVVPLDIAIGPAKAHGAGGGRGREGREGADGGPDRRGAQAPADPLDDLDMIVITGPNTGGKTVTLKTVGLLEIMGMSGLHIPAGDRSELSLFREIFADIGDEQSIEQSLSTFSSHMTSIVDILRRVDRECLCLFDELGAGTDPTEGAALAISILNFLHTRRITTLATTHYSELKVFAMRTEGIANASCEFDVETLRPTYRLMIGVPGKSNAFAISKRLGLPNYIIETAKEQLSQETQSFEDILSDLEETRRLAEHKRDEAANLSRELDKREKALKKREEQLEERRQEILRKANEEARDILQSAKEEADEAISELRKSGRGGDMTAMEQTRTAIREKVKQKNSALEYRAETSAPGRTKALRPEDLHVGDTVRVLSMGLTGTVHTLPDKSGRLYVTCGIMQSKVSLDDLALVGEDDMPAGRGAGSGSGSSGSALKRAFKGGAGGSGRQIDLSRGQNAQTEIVLLGMTTDEAIRNLDKFLDDARMSHLSSVRVVHGKGTGALRGAVQQYLRKQKWVKSYRAGEFGEGDAGVTIVEL